MDDEPERPHYERKADPTPEEIAIRAAAIRSTWSNLTERDRVRGPHRVPKPPDAKEPE